MRKYIALTVGLALTGSGLWWATLLIDADTYPGAGVLGSLFLTLLGAHLVWSTVREWTQVRS